MGELFRRFHYLITRRRRARELADEMAMHRKLAALEGAARPFGNETRLREDAADVWGWAWLDRLGQDVRFAWRLQRRSPGFTLVAILVLAIGIGANVAAFGFFNMLVLRPLPIREPKTMLRLERRAPSAYAGSVPYPEMLFVREHATTLSTVMGVASGRLTPDREGRPLAAQFVSANLFTELGAPMRLGRGLDVRDADPSADAVVVLSYVYWVRRYGADPSIVGRILRLNGRAASIVGVAEPTFNGLTLDSPDVWLPIERHPYFVANSVLLTDMSGDGVQVFARLRPSATPAAAQAELRELTSALRRERPDAVWEGEWLRASPAGYATGLMNGGRRGTGQPPSGELLVVFGLVSALAVLILVAACANLGGLLLARGVAREREMTIRAALGAGRGRLVRQLLTETLLLALLGSAAGLVTGTAVLRRLIALSGAPAWLDPAPDWRVVAFAAGAAWAAALLFGLTPALHTARLRRSRTIARELLIGIQVTASCVLVIVASLLTRGIVRVSTADLRADVEHIVSVNPDLRSHGYSPARARVFFTTLAARLGRLPGISSVALAGHAPLGRVTETIGLEVDEHPISVLVNRVSAEFFDTMRIPLLQGRTFAAEERRGLIVSDAMARRIWPGEPAVGRTLELGHDASGHPAVFTVVGLVASSRLPNPNAPDAVEAYLPITPEDEASLVALVRMSDSSSRLSASIVRAVQASDAELFPEVEPLSAWLDRRVQSSGYVALGVGTLGLIALVIGCLGIVALVAYAVVQRRTEIGIRMALGARPRDVLVVFGRRFVWPIAIGLTAGIFGAAALSQLLRAQLFGVSPLDPVTYLGAAGVFAIAATLATVLPARRALCVDPLVALRHE